MELLICFKSLGRYLSESPEHIRHQLLNELLDRLHRKERNCSNHLSLVCDESIQFKSSLAKLIVRDPDAPASVLARLASLNDPDVLERIAEHNRTSSYTLATLAESEHVEVRMAVAENANTPFPVLAKLAEDESADVRYRLAENPNVCVTILVRLEDDENPYVSVRASLTLERLNFGYKASFAA